MELGEIRVLFGSQAPEVTTDVAQADNSADEYLASSYVASRDRQPNDPNSASTREVTAMNREMDQWSQAAAPNVFDQEKSQ